MPLIKSRSKAAFSANAEAEMAAGKPQRQAVAIAEDVKRRADDTHGGHGRKVARQKVVRLRAERAGDAIIALELPKAVQRRGHAQHSRQTAEERGECIEPR
jgi:hypothetical protein